MRSDSNKRRFAQRGAIGIFGILTLLLAVLFVTLVVDSGRLWMQKRQLQAIADIAAIEAAKSLGCNSRLSDVVAAAQAAAASNGFDGALASQPNMVEMGRTVTSGGKRQFQAGNGNEAVRVVATRSVPASLFAGGLFSQQVLLSAQAVSVVNVPIAVFSAGTSSANLNTQDSALLNSLLTRLLGSNINLSLASYKGLADTNITLAQLLEAQGTVTSVEQLLALDLTTRQYLDLLSRAVSLTGTVTADIVHDLQVLALAASKGNIVRIADVLDIAYPDPNAVLGVGVNLLSLINTGAIVANGENGITLPLAINIGSLVNTSTTINIIEPPQIAIGPPASASGEACTVARTAQVRILSGVSASVLGLARIDLGLRVEVAQGEASLQSVTDTGSITQVSINGRPGIASVRLTGSSGNGEASISALLGLARLAEISLNLPLAEPTGRAMDFSVARPAKNNLPQVRSTSTQVSSSLANALNLSSTLQVKLVGLDLFGIVGRVLEPVVRPLLVTLASTIIDPLLKLLGIQLGVLEVNLEGIQLIQPQPLII